MKKTKRQPERAVDNNRYLYLGARIHMSQMEYVLGHAQEMAEEFERAHPGAKCEIYVSASPVAGGAGYTLTVEIERPEPV